MIHLEEGKIVQGLYMAKDYINRTIETGYYKLRMLR